MGVLLIFIETSTLLDIFSRHVALQVSGSYVGEKNAQVADSELKKSTYIYNMAK